MRDYKVNNNKLLWGGHVVDDLAAKFGTPLFVYNEDIIIQSTNELQKGPWEIHYAVKANPSPEILKTLLQYDVGIDAVSANEVDYVISLGFDPKKIVYTSSSLFEDEAKRVIDHGVLVNVNSIEEIELHGKVAEGMNIGIRINPDVIAGHHKHTQTAGEISKFGIHLADVPKAIQMAAKYNLKITMAHFHVGSGVLDADLFIEATENVLETIKTLYLPDLTHVNLGGGFGTPYYPEEKRLGLDRLITEVKKMHLDFNTFTGKDTTLVVEPGRYLVNESGILLVNLNTVSRNDHRIFYRTDSGFNHLIRPAMYGSYHHFINATQVEGTKEKIILSGNICEGGDVFNEKPREITAAKSGDTIAIFDVGAYGVAMGMNLYNLQGLPSEVMIKSDGTLKLFAKKQTLKDIISRYEF